MVRKRTGIVVLAAAVLLVALTTAVALAGEASRPERTARSAVAPMVDQSRVEIAGNLYLNDAANLVTIRPPTVATGRFVRPKLQELPEEWNLSEVAVSPDGQTCAINGYQALLVDAGIHVWDPEAKDWQPLTWRCTDQSLSWLTATDLTFVTCADLQWRVMKVSVEGGEPVAVYTSDYALASAAANPITGAMAVVEEYYGPVGDSEEWATQRRIVFLDAGGQVVCRLPWVVDWSLGRLRWSPLGDELMYVGGWWYGEGYGLYRTHAMSYGGRVENDVDAFTYLPDGGYAFARLICPVGCDYTDRKRPGPSTDITLKPAEEAAGTFPVKGHLLWMDAYAD